MPVNEEYPAMSKSKPTKMLNSQEVEIMEWKEQAKKLFFEEHLSIVDISVLVKKTRQTVATHLALIDGYEEEQSNRKQINKAKRDGYKKKWDKDNRQRGLGDAEKAILKRQHDIDVQVLSNEKF